MAETYTEEKMLSHAQSAMSLFADPSSEELTQLCHQTALSFGKEKQVCGSLVGEVATGLGK